MYYSFWAFFPIRIIFLKKLGIYIFFDIEKFSLKLNDWSKYLNKFLLNKEANKVKEKYSIIEDIGND